MNNRLAAVSVGRALVLRLLDDEILCNCPTNLLAALATHPIHHTFDESPAQWELPIRFECREDSVGSNTVTTRPVEPGLAGYEG